MLTEAVILEIIKLIGVSVAATAAVKAAYYSKRGAKHSSEINDAVNHSHRHGSTRIYDMVKDIYRSTVSNRRMIEEALNLSRHTESEMIDLRAAAAALREKLEKIEYEKNNPGVVENDDIRGTCGEPDPDRRDSIGDDR